MGTQKVLSRSGKVEVLDNCNYYNCNFQEAVGEQFPSSDDRNTNSCVELGVEQRTGMNVWG